MYLLARISLMLSVIAGVAGLALLAVVGWPASGWMGLLFGVALFVKRKGQRLTTLGSARWCDEDDARSAGLLDADSGLILGRLIGETGSDRSRLAMLFDARVPHRDACQKFWASQRGDRRPLVRLPRAVHTAVFSPSGGGKGVSCVIPFLMTCPDSCVVVDFKGENALRTAMHRRKQFGHRIVLLDPFRVVTDQPDTFNPLDAIAASSPYAIDECNDLAKALVVRTGDEREPHWGDAAEAWIAAILATVVQYGNLDESRSLQMARDLLTHPVKLNEAVKVMCESDCWGGMLARLGGQLLHFVDKEKSSTLTSVGRHLRFLDTLAVADSTRTTSFESGMLRSGKMTVFLILPPDHMRAQSGLLRLWISALLREAIRGGLQEANKIHFILDEAASLGHLEAIDDAIDKYRGYGLRLQLYFQSLGQLKKCFPDGQDQTLLSNANQIYFGINDNASADYISTRLGDSTILVDSGGQSSGGSSQWSQGPQPSSGGGYSYNASSNWQQQTRRLLKTEEVMALSGRTAITFTPGVPPILTTLLRYYEEPQLGRSTGWSRRAVAACSSLAASLVLCGASVAGTGKLFEGFQRWAAAQQRQTPSAAKPTSRPSAKTTVKSPAVGRPTKSTVKPTKKPQPGVPARDRYPFSRR